MKVVIGGPFSVYDRMKELARELEELGMEVFVPRHCFGYSDSKEIEKFKDEVKTGKRKLSREDLLKIGEVEAWFFRRIREADYVILFVEAIKNDEEVKGYTGINSAMDYAYALAKGKNIILTCYPEDVGVRGLTRYIEEVNPNDLGRVKVMDVDSIKRFLKAQVDNAIISNS